MKDNTEKLIRDYSEGSLTGHDLQEFEMQLKNDPQIQADLELYLALKALDNKRLKKQLLQSEDAEKLTPQVPPASLVRWFPQLLAVAASVAVVVAAVWWWQQSVKTDAAQLAQTYISTPYPPPVTTMGATERRSAAWQQAILAYRNNDFNTAAKALTALSAAPDVDDETLFYTGEALLQTGQFEQAITFFDRVNPGYWREIANWRCALALIKTDQTDRARSLLEKLRQGDRRNQAEALLKNLNNQ